MRLHDLHPAPGSKHRKKRLGRGIGSGHGRTAGRGTKGQKAREQVRPGFEGGQTPLIHRIPHKRGFKNPFRVEYEIVNVSKLNRFKENEVITPELLAQHGLIKHLDRPLKILGDGNLVKPLVIQAHKFSQSALEKIQRVGGRAEIL